MLADELDYVIGVDTHRDEHVIARSYRAGGCGGCGRSVAANARGYRAVLRFAGRLAPGRRAWAIEGTGSYGAGLARFLAGRASWCSSSAAHRLASGGCAAKTTALDAARTARAALASETLALPRAGQRREALRLLLVARRGAVDVRREALRQLRAVIVTAPEPAPRRATRAPVGKLLDRCTRLRRSSAATARRTRDPTRPAQPRSPHPGRNSRGRRARARDPRPRARPRASTARRARRRPNRRRPADRRLVTPGRLRSEACFARLAGVAPIPASSGQDQRHRLSRGGDRQLNRALHTSSSTAANTTQRPATTSPAGRRRQKPTRRHPATQALPRPPPLPTTRTAAAS